MRLGEMNDERREYHDHDHELSWVSYTLLLGGFECCAIFDVLVANPGFGVGVSLFRFRALPLLWEAQR